MPMSPSGPRIDTAAVLLRRCRQALQDHRRKAKVDMIRLDYGLADLVVLVKDSPTCFYCRCPLDFTFQFDHKTPIARTPQAHTLRNLAVVCAPCNAAKGQLDAEEYRRLLSLLDGFHPAARADVLRRLKAGGKRYRT